MDNSLTTEEDIRKILRILKARYGEEKLKASLNTLLECENIVVVYSVIIKLGNLDPPLITIIDNLLTMDMGNDEQFDGDTVTQFLRNLVRIYGNNTDAITNATDKILYHGLNLEQTVAVADSLEYLFTEELTKPDQKYYQGSRPKAIQGITHSVDSLSTKSVNSKPFLGNGLARHTDPKDGHDHMAEMGAISPQDYERKAMNFMNGEHDTDELQLERPNGEIIRYNTKTHESGIVDKNGAMITYFRIDEGSLEADLDYFFKQIFNIVDR